MLTAPEALKFNEDKQIYEIGGMIDQKYDIWSFGVLLYILLHYPNEPFTQFELTDGESKKCNVQSTFKNIKQQKFLTQDWTDFSNNKFNIYKQEETKVPLLIDLLKHCFIANPQQRPSAATLLRHPFFTQI